MVRRLNCACRHQKYDLGSYSLFERIALVVEPIGFRGAAHLFAKEPIEVAYIFKAAAFDHVINREFRTAQKLGCVFDADAIDVLGRGETGDSLAGSANMFM